MAVLRALFGSKKFVSALVGVLVAAAGKYGLELETEAVMAIVSPLLAYIVGQGVADFGKGAR